MPLYRGSGGAIFEVTPPESGSLRENFDAAVARGELVLVEQPADDTPEQEPPADEQADAPAPAPRRRTKAAKPADDTPEV